MDMFTSAIIEAGIDTLSALADADHATCLEHQPLENGYRKFVFFLKKRPDEEQLEVRINARISLLYDCNMSDYLRREGLESNLEKTTAGYYRLARPLYASTKMGCPPPKHVETHKLKGQGYTLPYNSNTPIVIHAFAGFDPKEDVHISYDIIEKAAINSIGL